MYRILYCTVSNTYNQFYIVSNMYHVLYCIVAKRYHRFRLITQTVPTPPCQPIPSYPPVWFSIKQEVLLPLNLPIAHSAG